MNETAAIRNVLQAYFDVLYHCDLETFDNVFHQHAVYATADEDTPMFLNMREYRQVIANRESPALRNEARKDVIDSIEFAGSSTARARVRCSIGTKDFVDFLTLIRIENQWSIIAKIFQIVKT